jgi:hypothetical protein
MRMAELVASPTVAIPKLSIIIATWLPFFAVRRMTPVWLTTPSIFEKKSSRSPLAWTVDGTGNNSSALGWREA